MADIFTKKKRSEVMSRIRSKDTKPELRLRKAVFKRGMRYRLHSKKLPGKPDMVMHRKKLAVFCHGCFWHGHEGCYREPKSNTDYWRKKLARNKARDKRVVAELEKMGWRVIQVWECDIKKRLDKVVDSIECIYKEPQTPSPARSI